MTEPTGRVQPGDDPDFMLRLAALALRQRALQPLVSSDPDPLSRRSLLCRAIENYRSIVTRFAAQFPGGLAPQDIRRADFEAARAAAAGAIAVQLERCLPEKLDTRSGVRHVSPISDRALVATTDFLRSEARINLGATVTSITSLLKAYEELVNAITEDEDLALFQPDMNGTQKVRVITVPDADLPRHDVLDDTIIPRSSGKSPEQKRRAKQLRKLDEQLDGKKPAISKKGLRILHQRNLRKAVEENNRLQVAAAKKPPAPTAPKRPLTPLARNAARLEAQSGRHSVVTQRTGEGICSCGFASYDQRLVVAHLKGSR